MTKYPSKYSFWKHKNGTIYFVLTITNKTAPVGKQEEYPLTVVYQNIKTEEIWSRLLTRWHGSMTEIAIGEAMGVQHETSGDGHE